MTGCLISEGAEFNSSLINGVNKLKNNMLIGDGWLEHWPMEVWAEFERVNLGTPEIAARELRLLVDYKRGSLSSTGQKPTLSAASLPLPFFWLCCALWLYIGFPSIFPPKKK